MGEELHYRVYTMTGLPGKLRRHATLTRVKDSPFNIDGKSTYHFKVKKIGCIQLVLQGA
jgi:hypothetical protein